MKVVLALTTITLLGGCSGTVANTVGHGASGAGGTTSTGGKAPAGTYSITMQGTNAEGNSVNISTQYSGVVTGVDFSGAEPVLLIGNSRVNLSGVTTVSQTATTPPADDSGSDDTGTDDTSAP